MLAFKTEAAAPDVDEESITTDLQELSSKRPSFTFESSDFVTSLNSHGSRIERIVQKLEELKRGKEGQRNRCLSSCVDELEQMKNGLTFDKTRSSDIVKKTQQMKYYFEKVMNRYSINNFEKVMEIHEKRNKFIQDVLEGQKKEILDLKTKDVGKDLKMGRKIRFLDTQYVKYRDLCFELENELEEKSKKLEKANEMKRKLEKRVRNQKVVIDFKTQQYRNADNEFHKRMGFVKEKLMEEIESNHTEMDVLKKAVKESKGSKREGKFLQRKAKSLERKLKEVEEEKKKIEEEKVELLEAIEFEKESDSSAKAMEKEKLLKSLDTQRKEHELVVEERDDFITKLSSQNEELHEVIKKSDDLNSKLKVKVEELQLQMSEEEGKFEKEKETLNSTYKKLLLKKDKDIEELQGMLKSKEKSSEEKLIAKEKSSVKELEEVKKMIVVRDEELKKLKSEIISLEDSQRQVQNELGKEKEQSNHWKELWKVADTKKTKCL